jgi:hypothetical protein
MTAQAIRLAVDGAEDSPGSTARGRAMPVYIARLFILGGLKSRRVN